MIAFSCYHLVLEKTDISYYSQDRRKKRNSQKYYQDRITHVYRKVNLNPLHCLQKLIKQCNEVYQRSQIKMGLANFERAIRVAKNEEIGNPTNSNDYS